MAVNKSKLNSKLPKVTDIRFCTSAGKNLCKGISTGENSKFSIAVNFKQPSSRTSYTSYQIQYRSRDWFLVENGSNYTFWSNWKNMKAMTGIAQGSTKDPDEWRKGNHGICKTTYNQFWKWTNAGIGGKYIQRAYQFRVRVYNGKNSTHGPWVTSEALTIKRRCACENETIFIAYGEAYLDFNYQWPEADGVLMRIHSVKDAKGRELKGYKLDQGVRLDKTRTASSTPPLRTGWHPGRHKFVLLYRTPARGEKLTIDGWLEVCQTGARTYFTKNLTVSKIDYEVNTPKIAFAVNKTAASLTVRVYKSDADDVITSGNVTLKYTYNGKEYQQSAYSISKSLGIKNTTDPIMTAVFPFCPLNTQLNVTASIGSGLGNASYRKAVTINTGRAWFVGKANNPARIAALLVSEGDYPSFEARSQGKSTVELAYGRPLPFAAFSPGTTTELQISGTATESSLGIPGVPQRSAPRYWNEVRYDPGIYYLRGPNGEVHKAALQEVQMTRGNKDTTNVTASFKEVY